MKITSVSLCVTTVIMTQTMGVRSSHLPSADTVSKLNNPGILKVSEEPFPAGEKINVVKDEC